MHAYRQTGRNNYITRYIQQGHKNSVQHPTANLYLISWTLHFCINLRFCISHFSNLIVSQHVDVTQKQLRKSNKKAVLSQRWPRNAPYTWVPSKFSGLPDYAHGYYSQHFSRTFVRIDPLNVPTKFEVRSFIRSSDNRGYPKNLDSPSIRPRSHFLQNF